MDVKILQISGFKFGRYAENPLSLHRTNKVVH